MSKDIFSITDTSDLPQKLAADITPKDRGRKGPRGSKLISLMAMANRSLTANEVCAAYYRQFGKARTLQSVRGQLSAYSRQGRLVRVARGRYMLPASSLAAE